MQNLTRAGTELVRHNAMPMYDVVERLIDYGLILDKVGSFGSGISVRRASDAVLHSDGMYYVYTGTFPKVVPAAPDSSWLCAGELHGYRTNELMNFGAKGNAVDDDTDAIQLWIKFLNATKAVGVANGGKVFMHRHLQFTGIKGIWITGTGEFRNLGGQTGAQFYANGAMFSFNGGGNEDIVFFGPTLDGNRSASPLYTGFNHGIQFATGPDDYRSNNGGEDKPNKRIRIERCTFKNMGGYNTGRDKFGDGVYLFGVDDVVIHECKFIDMGRWGVAASDVFNLRVTNNYCDNSKSGTVALGFFDLENESTDNVRGSYSRNIIVQGNILKGFGQILVGAGSNSENYQGTNHYLRNVLVKDNLMTVAGGPHADPDYQVNLLMIGCAPFCKVVPTGSPVENSNILFENNIIRCEISNQMVGMGINAQNSNNGLNCVVRGVGFYGNRVEGFYKPMQLQEDVIGSGGYTFLDIVVDANMLACGGAGGLGLRLAATQLVNYAVTNNLIRGSTVRAISVEDGRSFGAIDTMGTVADNQMQATTGVGLFMYCYRTAMHGNTVHGGAQALDATVTVMDKDYGNTWNYLIRSMPPISISTGTSATIPNIDIGSQTRFGYAVQPIAPFPVSQAIIQATVAAPGLATMTVGNLSGSTFGVAADDWTFYVHRL